jgi:DNA-binding response OmpR family regulator
MATLLVIDDEPGLRTFIKDMFQEAGHTVVAAANATLGLARFKEGAFDVVITDLVLPDKEGNEMIAEMRQLLPGQKIVAISGGGPKRNPEFLDIAEELGADQLLPKPFSMHDLRRAVAACLEK